VKRRRWLCCALLLALVFHLANALSLADTATPGFKIVAGNADLPGRGEGASQYTITSVNGFTGKVFVICNGPDPNLYPDLIMPSCADPTQELTVPANGSVTGTMIFHPPWIDLSAHDASPFTGDAPGLARGSLPLLACAVVGVGLLGRRKKLRSFLVLTLAVTCLGLLAGTVGCIGSGGLQMTPGIYTFTLTGTSSGLIETGKVSVTVRCNTCP